MAINYNTKTVTEKLRCLIDPGNPRCIGPTSNQAFDLSGNLNHAIIRNQNGSQTSLGSMAGVLEYDTSEGAIPCLNFSGYGNSTQGYLEWDTHPCEGDDTYSVEAFFKITQSQPSSDYNVIFYSSVSTANQELGLMAQNSTSDPDVAIEIGDAYTAGSSNVRASLGWHHFVVTHDGSTSRLYLDGKLVYSRSDSNGPLGSTWDWIGVGQWASNGQYSGGYGYTQGKLGYLSLYGKALTDKEVKQNFQAFRGRYGI